MYAEERQAAIAAQVTKRGSAGVNELAERFGLTTETIRRDLAALEREGFLRRVHGGAVGVTTGSVVEYSLNDRQVRRRDEKMKIARAAMDMVPPTGSIIVDAGTSTDCLAEELAGRPNPCPAEELIVITNAVSIAYRLAGIDHLTLQMLGGRVRGLTRAAVGSETVNGLADIRPDVAFLGANGLHSHFGLSTPDPAEAAVKKAIVQSARRVIALVDSSKFEQESLIKFAGIGEIDLVITDDRPGQQLQSALDEAGVELMIA